jgi:hypothetical protein
VSRHQWNRSNKWEPNAKSRTYISKIKEFNEEIKSLKFTNKTPLLKDIVLVE